MNKPAADTPGEGLLGTGGAVAGAAAVMARRARRRDGSHRADIDWGGGRKQSLVLLEGPDSPREHVFEMDVPPSGRMNKNADGSVDIVDAQGNVVEHVQAPWAYDVSGRKVPTWYEVGEDNRLVQVIDPQRTTALPVVADPDKKKSTGASPYKAKGTKGSQTPQRQKIKGFGQPPSSQKGSGNPMPAAPKTSAVKTGTQPKPPAKQPETKMLPPGTPRRKIKSIGGPQQPTSGNSPVQSENLLGKDLLKSPPADPNKKCVVPEGQLLNKDGTFNLNYQRDFSKEVNSRGGNSDFEKHVRPGKDPLPPDYSQVGKPLPPNAPRRKIKAVGGPQPDPYVQERSGVRNNSSPNRNLDKASVGKSKEENKGFRKGVKDKIRSGVKKVNEWGHDKFEESDKSIKKRENSDGKVERGLAKGERLVHRGTKAVYESVGDGIAASAPLVGLGKDGGPGVKESWRDGPGSLVGASDNVSPKEAWKAVGKEAIAYDEWRNKEYPEAVALTATNLIGLKGVDKVGKAIKPKKPTQPVPPPKVTPKPAQISPRVQGKNPRKPVEGTPKKPQAAKPETVPSRVSSLQQAPTSNGTAKVDPSPAWYRAEG
ncbi:hypothetical protein H7347_01385 [Corynebacterium sp. zg-331]|uniref:hypothetical protein n=1 Tax=unclassified Corynebacterium TaxID=2624378 RepID=UPI00128DAC86|nr:MULTISPECIES: hypothetical protein [unclassified Corynebacterium]MBC3185240.1 hypothetical protein [Corynebacterium sp. zg-331]MPV51738.1 hypothetical protein [Corynebacterium sp. zg331]